MASELAKILADFRTQLTAKISVGGTTGAIQTNVDDDGVTIPNGTYYFTIDGDNSQKEYIQCTVTGLNLTAIKSVSRQGVLTSGTVREHRVGAIVTVTDYGIIKKMLDLLDGTTDFDATNPLKYDADPTITDGKHLATKKYADDLAIAGSPKATNSVYGITKLSTPAVDPVVPIAVGDNDTRVPTQDENNALVGTSGTPSTTNKFVTENDTSNYATITASTISFTASTKTIGDSGSGFVTANFRAGDSIAITGSASNNGTFTIVSVLAGAIVVAETLTDESASATVTMETVTANKIVRRKSDSNITVPTTPTSGTDAASKSYIDNLVTKVYTVSNDLLLSADTEKTSASGSYTKVKEILIGRGGIFRVKFDISNSTGNYNVYGKIYKNGVAYGTEQLGGTGYTTKSEDLSFHSGDTVELWIYTPSASDACKVRNLRIYGTLANGNVVITD